MVSHTVKNKTNAKAYAARMRAKGFNANIYPKKKGHGVSVTRNKYSAKR